MLKFRILQILSLVVLFFGLYMNQLEVVVVSIILFFCGTAILVFNIKLNGFIHSITKNRFTASNSVALTFDDGPDPVFTPLVLDLLKKNNAKATFFVIGEKVEKYPSILKRIVDEGHTVGNHTFYHKHTFPFTAPKKIKEELEKTNKTIDKVIGKKSLFFRPPMGITNPNIAKAIKNTSFTSISWSLRPYDTQVINYKQIVNRITKGIKKGDIVLLHDTHEFIEPSLKEILTWMNKNELSSITVEQLLNKQAYL